MKVKELIALLIEHADPDEVVDVEGCDCVGDAVGIDVGNYQPGRVLIARSSCEFPAPLDKEELEIQRRAAEEREREAIIAREYQLKHKAEQFGLTVEQVKGMMP